MFSRLAALQVWVLIGLLLIYLAHIGACQTNQVPFSSAPEIVCNLIPESLSPFPCPAWIPPALCAPPRHGGKLPQVSKCCYAKDVNCGNICCVGTCLSFGRPGHQYFSCIHETDDHCKSIGATGLCVKGECNRPGVCIENCCFVLPLDDNDE